MNRRFRPKDPTRVSRFQRENLKKGVYILPNLFTSAGLLAGFYSIVATMNGQYTYAAWAVVVSLFCDGADGRVARMTRTTSRFGVEYDSLADLVAFGVAPALLAYQWALIPYGKWGWSAAFLYVVCGALRLARYNVQIDNIESVTFNGLPIPVAATMVVSTILLFHGQLDENVKHVAVLVMIFVLALLMVSNVKFISFKQMEIRKRKPFTAFVGVILLGVFLVNEPAIGLFSLSAIYVAHGPIRSLILWRKKPAGNGAPRATDDAFQEDPNPEPPLDGTQNPTDR